jgi:hypothetical protein
MSQHDYVIDNQSAPAARADINAVLQAIATTNSGGASPVTTYANQIWYDTATNEIKKRNEANSAWIVLGTVDEAGSTFTPNSLLTTTGIAPATLVTAAETIASNNNDTTLPTSAAVKNYADITANNYGAYYYSLVNIPGTIAATTVGAVGSYGFCFDADPLSGGASRTPGALVAGSNLRFATAAATNTGLAQPVGTWRLMGWSQYGTSVTPLTAKVSLWLRAA